MIKILLKLSILLFSIQLTAQTSSDIVNGMGKWVPIKTDFYSNNKLTDTENFTFDEKCIPYIDFQEDGILLTKEFDSDCEENKSESGTYKYIGDGFYRISQNEQYYDAKPKINGREMQLIITSKDENGEELKVIAHFKRYDSFKKTEAKEVVAYHENGNVKSKRIYVNGKKNGLSLVYWENGQLRWKGNNKNDKLTGEWYGYYENGNLMRITNYIDGKKEGKAKIMCNDEDYDCYSTGNYVNNIKTGTWKEYSYGYLSSSGPYENQQKNGKWEVYFLGHGEKDISATGNYLNGKREGEWKVYFGKGLIKSTGYYENGKKIGVWKFYDKDGTLTKTETQ